MGRSVLGHGPSINPIWALSDIHGMHTATGALNCSSMKLDVPPELKSKFLQLQQDADFALARAREGNTAVKQAYARHLAGQGPAPSQDQLDALAELERDAEVKYRALRTFTREAFGAS
jgi:hypothetical protein